MHDVSQIRPGSAGRHFLDRFQPRASGPDLPGPVGGRSRSVEGRLRPLDPGDGGVRMEAGPVGPILGVAPAVLDGSGPETRTFRMAGVYRFRPVAIAWLVTAAIVGSWFAARAARADTIILKNGTIYRGTVDRDNTLVFVSDNLRRVIFYSSKIEKVESDTGFSQNERFELVQPLEVHAGVMPT